MADCEELARILTPFFHHLQRMEAELKCSICLNLLEIPTLLPCDHLVCHGCIPQLKKRSSSCAICSSTFLHRDLRPAVHIREMVKIFSDMDTSIGVILQQRESHDETPSRQHEPPSTAPGFVESIKISPTNDLPKKVDISAMKEGSWLDASSSETHHSGKMENITKKQHLLQTEESGVGPKKTKGDKLKNSHGRQFNRQPLHTPTRLFADECAFCHSFRTTEASGSMLCYINGKLVAADEANQLNIVHVHQKCVEWSPQVYFSGDIVNNLEIELARASKIKCSKCGLKGAALGCYYKSCQRSFHVPCAVEVPDCRWDCENFLVLCPSHSSEKLPCDSSNAMKRISLTSSSTKISMKPAELAISWQKDQLDYVLLGSDLTPSDKELLGKFATLTGATVLNKWGPNVTHVIAATNEKGACHRTQKVLMAILTAKWVITIDWIKACIEAGHLVSEERFGINLDMHGPFDGPRKGRIRAIEKAPKLLAGFDFYFSGYFVPFYKRCLEDLVVAAGGTIMEDGFLMSNLSASESSPLTYFVYNEDPPQECSSGDLVKVKEERCEEAVAYANRTNAQVIGHTKLLDAIAAFDSHLLNRGKTSIS
ncbi:BRCA1-associated RING domain protein 1-like [Typha latifolia]|uniref:BRCA1-associated RING domain protein 1-like n=1 Tax=Typha latifolia TaxID=4733 RepID=UPI003C2CF846